jgi:hypothetical protein
VKGDEMTDVLAGIIALAVVILIGLPLMYILLMAIVYYLKFVTDLIDKIGKKIKEAIL